MAGAFFSRLSLGEQGSCRGLAGVFHGDDTVCVRVLGHSEVQCDGRDRRDDTFQTKRLVCSAQPEGKTVVDGAADEW